jgi:hypothetical protein
MRGVPQPLTAAKNQDRVPLAIRQESIAWLVLAMPGLLLMILPDSRLPHAFKHFFRHLW